MHDPLAILKAAYRGEAIFRPSSIERVIECPGSVVLIARVLSTTNFQRLPTRWSLEGSAMHALAEKVLRGDPDVPDPWEDFRYTEGGHIVQITAQMADAVEAYIDKINEQWRPGMVRYVEQKLSLSGLNPHEPLFAENRGTTDCVQLDYERHIIHIHDLKGGQGHMVPADAPQMQNYALNALVTYPPPLDGFWEEIDVHVSQPRAEDECEHYKHQAFTPTEIVRDFGGKLSDAMRRAIEPNAPLNPGPWCRWCTAKLALGCPAYQTSAFTAVKNPFDSLPPPPTFTANSNLPALPKQIIVSDKIVTDPGILVLRPLNMLSNDDLAALYEDLQMLEDYAAAARHLGVTRMAFGAKIPGWAISQRSGRRVFIESEEVVIQRLLALADGLTVEELRTRPALKSVHQVELVMKKHSQTVPTDLYKRPKGAVVLVPANSVKAATPVPPIFGQLELPATARKALEKATEEDEIYQP